MPRTNHSPANDLWETSMIRDVRDVAFVATIYLFFTGFVYRYFFLAGFGIAPSVIEVSPSTLLVYSFQVFYDNVLFVAIAVGCAIAIWLRFGRRVASEFQAAGAMVCAIALFPILFLMALGTGSRSVESIRNKAASGDLTPITMSVRSDRLNYSDFFLHSVGNDAAAFLLDQNSDTYFVLVQPPKQTSANNVPTANKNIPEATVFGVPKNDVNHLRFGLPAIRK